MSKRMRLVTSLCSLAAIWFAVEVGGASVVVSGQEPAPAGAGAAAAPGGAATELPSVKRPMSTFWWVVKSSGWIGAFILGLSIYFVATIIQLFIELRAEVAMPAEEVAQCEQLL